LKKLFLLLLVFVAVNLQAQNKVGVRTGLNFSNILTDDLEQGESYNFSSGFHFGVNYTYQLVPSFGIRGELLYVQRGSRYRFENQEDVYVLLRPGRESDFGDFIPFGDPPIAEFGTKDLDVKLSTGYLSIPITAQLQLTDKWELFGGISIDLLLNPTGRGSLSFESAARPDEIVFIQTLDHKYRGDEPYQLNFLQNRDPIFLLINGEDVPISRNQSAYYNIRENQKMGNKFKFFDSHLIFGVNYFINSGFYAGVRGHYGLTDITNDNMDFSVRDLTDELEYIRRNDRDRSVSLEVSIGFRF